MARGLKGRIRIRFSGCSRGMKHPGEWKVRAWLGLTIVKEIAEQHDGKVWIGPAAGRGTAFYVSVSKKL